MKELENILGYEFENIDLLFAATTHPSVFRRSRRVHLAFERLEFLGDRVLGLCIATLLYSHLKGEDEGDFATRIAYLASTASLIKMAHKTGILKHFGLSKDEKNTNASSIADMVEATLAAVYLDSNFETALRVIQKLFGDELYQTQVKKKDPKSALQEYSQKLGYGLPIYNVVDSQGLQHNLTFKVKVQVKDEIGYGTGKNKREAEQEAARELLKKVQDE